MEMQLILNLTTKCLLDLLISLARTQYQTPLPKGNKFKLHPMRTNG